MAATVATAKRGGGLNPGDDSGRDGTGGRGRASKHFDWVVSGTSRANGAPLKAGTGSGALSASRNDLAK